MTNNAQKAVDMLSTKSSSILLGIIVAMMGWYLPNLSSKVDENQRMERTKLEQIYQIKTATHDLNNTVLDIENEIGEIKKKNEYIWKSVDGRFDIVSSDIKMLCSQIKKYGETANWVDHPECKSK